MKMQFVVDEILLTEGEVGVKKNFFGDEDEHEILMAFFDGYAQEVVCLNPEVEDYRKLKYELKTDKDAITLTYPHKRDLTKEQKEDILFHCGRTGSYYEIALTFGVAHRLRKY